MYRVLTFRMNRRLQYYVSGHLFYQFQLLVGSRNGNVSGVEDYILSTDVFDREVVSRRKVKDSGHRLEHVSPATDHLWNFKVQHSNTQSEMDAEGG
ncbi:hypothetical protein ABHI18_005568 [Aspergillus niger]